MTPKIKVLVETDPEEPTRVIVSFVAEGISLEHSIPPCVQNDLLWEKCRTFDGGYPPNTAAYRQQLADRLQAVIDRHRDAGNMEYLQGVGFLRYRGSGTLRSH